MSTRFEPGAPAPAGNVPLSVPQMGGNEWKYIKECLDTNWVSSVGPHVDRFEHEAAVLIGAKHAVACVNGTAALHVALLVAGVTRDDEVLVPTLTFIAPANAIRYVGAWPAFIDAEPDYWQMDVRKVEEFLVQGCRFDGKELRNRRTGRRVSAILPVHILGQTVDMDPILQMARKFHLVIIEDAAEGLGAKYKGRMAGHLGDIACLSFNGNKIVTTGGGGMILSDNKTWADRARHLTTQARSDPLEYIHDEIGYNYRLTNVLAALGCAQLEKLDEYVAAKRRIASTYVQQLHEIEGLTPMREAPWACSTFWLFTILVDPVRYGISSRELLKKLASAGIQSRPLWQPLHRSPAHASCRVDCPVADDLYSLGLSLPSSAGLTEDAQQRVIDCLRRR